ncbi:hypothetical protein HanIR_Chr14g0705811 [Helianthus annuus]|nr:hypothetical protein HanIR_Chr14g0705811 [Helianthus annuus]
MPVRVVDTILLDITRILRLLDTLRFRTCSLGSWECHWACYLMQTIKIMKFKMIWFDYIETVTIASAEHMLC